MNENALIIHSVLPVLLSNYFIPTISICSRSLILSLNLIYGTEAAILTLLFLHFSRNLCCCVLCSSSVCPIYLWMITVRSARPCLLSHLSLPCSFFLQTRAHYIVPQYQQCYRVVTNTDNPAT